MELMKLVTRVSTSIATTAIQEEREREKSKRRETSMRKPSDSKTEAEASDDAYILYPCCFLVEAVKAVILKCLGLCNVQEPCSSSSSDPPPTSPSTPATNDPEPPAVDVAVDSLARPPRPGPGRGRPPQIN